MKNTYLSNEALEILKNSIYKNRLAMKNDSNIIFVCGAKLDPNYLNGRGQFLKYANKYYKKFQFLLAEDFFNAFTNDFDHDLLSIEDKLSKYSDCIIIIVESPSALSELGAFAIKDELAKIMLVINDQEFSNCGSFIDLGPIKKVNKKSVFKPVIECDLNNILFNEADISERLNRITRKNNKYIQMQNYDDFVSMEPKMKLLFLSDLVALFEPITFRELIRILISIWGENKFEIKFELSLLEAIGLVIIKDDHYLNTNKKNTLFYHYPNDAQLKIKSLSILHYQKNKQDKLFLLRRNIY